MSVNHSFEKCETEHGYQNNYDRLVEDILEKSNQELDSLIKIYEYIR